MIAKIISRNHGVGSFRDSINYNLGLSRGEKGKVEYVNTRGIFVPEVAALEMESLALENTRSADPVFNCVLSWRENEIPTKKQTDEAVDIVLRELELDGCQTHYALHRNTENLHLHVCINRIDPETYKARAPAHGWSKRALEKAAREIELAQGWEIERTGHYVVTADGKILEKPRESERIKLSQTARDIEAHTGERSAERIGQEIAAPIIRESQNWEEFHQKLAEQGITFEPKGSGAILHIGETVIKASQAGRDISLSKLKKRFGEYRDRDVTVKVRALAPEAVERIEAAPKIKRTWEDYQQAKAEYFLSKKGSLSELQNRHKKDREKLAAKHCAERAVLFRNSWKGKGAELNQYRSVIAARQTGEKLDLRERQQAERESLKKEFPRQFPSFKAWLNFDEDPKLMAIYRYSGQLVLLAADGVKNESIKKPDLRDYFPVIRGERGGVAYCRDGGNVADFIDYGGRIVISGQFSEQSVLAALQLAQQKWGGVQISGSKEYKQLCARLATKNNIKISNPELAPDTERRVAAPAVPILSKIGQEIFLSSKTLNQTGNAEKLAGKVTEIDPAKGTVKIATGNGKIYGFSKKTLEDEWNIEEVPYEQTLKCAYDKIAELEATGLVLPNARTSELAHRERLIDNVRLLEETAVYAIIVLDKESATPFVASIASLGKENMEKLRAARAAGHSVKLEKANGKITVKTLKEIAIEKDCRNEPSR
jgi:hypothetical protein